MLGIVADLEGFPTSFFALAFSMISLMPKLSTYTFHHKEGDGGLCTGNGCPRTSSAEGSSPRRRRTPAVTIRR